MQRLTTLWMGRGLSEAIARNARMMAELDRLLRPEGAHGA